MAGKGPIIVVKKITVAGHGHHGGSWKVALADFMTALMAFFLTMWLTSQSEETKKAISDYFNAPSLVEYYYANYGVEMTLEKLFLDLVNEPLRSIQTLLEPMDTTPNLLDLGSDRILSKHLKNELSDIARNVVVERDFFKFDIPDRLLFEPNSTDPAEKYVEIMTKVQSLTTGLDYAHVSITSALMFREDNPNIPKDKVQGIASKRLDMVRQSVYSSFENSTNRLDAEINVIETRRDLGDQPTIGFMRFVIQSMRPVATPPPTVKKVAPPKPILTRDLIPEVRMDEPAFNPLSNLGSDTH